MTYAEDLTTLIYIAGRPIRVDEVSAALGFDPEDVLDLVGQLAAEGVLSDTEAGISLEHEDFRPSSASRTAFLAGKWANALLSLGGSQAEIGLAFLTSGQHESAAEHLVPAAIADDAPEVIEAAITSIEAGARVSAEDEGLLRLARARHCRTRGESRRAAEDLEMAVRQLQGPALVDALGFAAAIADDLQHPQQSETLAVLAAAEAVRIEEPAKQGSLLTLQGRELSRIGFPEEAEQSIQVGRELLTEFGNEVQRDYGHWNEAWMLFDRGEVRKAEIEFSNLRDHARHGDPATLAEREAYWARSLFATGRVTEARESATRAETLAVGQGADAPRFIAALARMEGAILFGRYEDSLGYAESAHEIAARSLAAWVNVPLLGQARALAGLGRVEEAKEKLDAAMEVTPAGIDGWRWRIHAEVLEMALLSENENWPQRRAEDLTDSLLQARWYGAAVRLMAERARREADKELSLQGASLALQIGNPMLAAEAVEAAGVWRDPMVSVVARSIVQMEPHIPEEWRDEWLAHPPVASAHKVDLTDHAEEEPELERHIEEALKAAGLADTEIILSPAQRQARGLVRRRPSRTRKMLRAIAVAAGVVVLAGGTALAVTVAVGGPTPQEVVERIVERVVVETPTTIPGLEGTVVEVPSDTGVFGVAAYRGGNARNGVTDGGFRTVLGKYWDIRLPGSIETDPVALGNVFYLGTANPDNLLYLLLNNGVVLTASVETGGRVRSTPAFDPTGRSPYLAFGTDDGRVYALHTQQDQTYWDPPKSVGDVVSAAPLLFEYVAVVVTEDGVVRALSIEDRGEGLGVGGGDQRIIDWTYEGTEANPLGPVNSAPASDGEAIYLMDEEGWIHVIDVVTGAPLCQPILGNGSLARGANPVVSGDFVFFPTADGYLDRLRIGSCTLEALLFVGPSSFNLPVAILDDVLYAVEGPWLVAFDVPEGALNAVLRWTFTAEGQDPISTAPIYADGILYLGTRGGIVYAVDATDGTEVWRFDLGATVVGTPAVLNNAVIVTTENRVVAIAGE